MDSLPLHDRPTPARRHSSLQQSSSASSSSFPSQLQTSKTNSKMPLTKVKIPIYGEQQPLHHPHHHDRQQSQSATPTRHHHRQRDLSTSSHTPLPRSPRTSKARILSLMGVPKPTGLATQAATVPVPHKDGVVKDDAYYAHTVVAELDAMDEDPFTLDSFENLMRLHAAQNKDFIIARVDTVDPIDSEKIYHSHYSAHQINKVLFRTEPDAGLLHRMKARNPLNNMMIVGDVHYYSITAQEVNAIKPCSSRRSSRTSSQDRMNSSAKVKLSLSSPCDSTLSSARSSPILQSDISLWPSVDENPANNSSESNPPVSDHFSTSSTSPHHHRHLQAIPTLADTASAETTNSSTLTSFTAAAPPPALATATQPSSSSPILTPVAAPEEPSSSASPFSPTKPSRLRCLAGSSLPKRRSSTSSFTSSSSGSSPLHHQVLLKEFFAQHVSSGFVESPRSASGSRSPRHQSFSSSSPRTPSSRSPITRDAVPSTATVALPPAALYRMQFFATDDDFLLRSHVRQVFKTNALEKSDAILFTIKSNPSAQAPPRPPPFQQLEPWQTHEQRQHFQMDGSQQPQQQPQSQQQPALDGDQQFGHTHGQHHLLHRTDSSSSRATSRSSGSGYSTVSGDNYSRTSSEEYSTDDEGESEDADDGQEEVEEEEAGRVEQVDSNRLHEQNGQGENQPQDARSNQVQGFRGEGVTSRYHQSRRQWSSSSTGSGTIVPQVEAQVQMRGSALTRRPSLVQRFTHFLTRGNQSTRPVL